VGEIRWTIGDNSWCNDHGMGQHQWINVHFI